MTMLVTGFLALFTINFSIDALALTSQDLTTLNNFAGSKAVLNLKTIDADQKLNGELGTSPWAGYYWPDGFGSIAAPYRDSSFPSSVVRLIGPDSGFRRTMRWLRRKHGSDVSPNIYSLSEEEIDELSPAEKYDALFNAQNYTLTHSILNNIESRADHARIRTWEGICNGWSLASLNVDRPLKPVMVKSASGRMIPFYPHDLMALASLLYARSPVNDWDWYVQNGTERNRVAAADAEASNATMEPVWLKFVGRRCDHNAGETGCGDLNPAVLHLAVTNAIGYQNTGFVMDKHKNETISNVSVYGYSAKLYNPGNGDFGSFADSVIPSEDGFKVGVELTLKSRDELHPWKLKGEEKPYQELEKSSDEKYSYTLIMDAQYNIKDGYWSKHGVMRERQRLIPNYPDFLWKLPKDFKAYSGAEGNLNQYDFDPAQGIPESWKKDYTTAAELQQPLGVLIYQLVAASRQ